MKKTTVFCISALVAVVFVAIGLTGETYAEKRSVPEIAKGITLAGMFSGSLDGQIRIGNRKVEITRKTALRSTTSGQLKRGYHVVRKPITVSAVLDKNGKLQATMVVVNDGSRRVGGDIEELSSDAAR